MQQIKDDVSKRGRGISKHTPSYRGANGRMGEMVYDGTGKKTAYLEWDGSEVSRLEECSDGGVQLRPYSPHNSLVENRIVLFPSGALEYGTVAELIEAVRLFVHRYLDLDPVFERIASYYVLLTWVFDAFNELPYLRVRGDPGCGKTRFLLIVGSLCYKPIFASGASTVSPVFRMLDAIRGTLVIDESDFRFSDERAEIVKILNNGNGRGFPVLRCEQSPSSKEFSPRAYAVFGPKIVATRGPFEDLALESRCITREMTAGSLRSDIPINLPTSYEDEALELRNKLLLFRFRNLEKERDLSAVVDRAIEPRLNQVFAPLLSLIEDSAVREDLRRLIEGFQSNLVADRGLEVEAAILEVVRDLSRPGAPSPSVRSITDAFLASSGSRHPRVTPKAVGYILRKKLGLGTQKTGGVYVLSPAEHGKLEGLYRRYGVAAPDYEPLQSLFDVPQVPEVPPGEVL